MFGKGASSLGRFEDAGYDVTDELPGNPVATAMVMAPIGTPNLRPPSRRTTPSASISAPQGLRGFRQSIRRQATVLRHGQPLRPPHSSHVDQGSL